ncbi:MAG: hypothetical protein QOJ53_1090, partial [Sphingomonadales bacterium]|nr:hypothetical protein [Sphingomonadales bacterium]
MVDTSAIVIHADVRQPGLAGIAEPAGQCPLRQAIFVVAVAGADEVAIAVRNRDHAAALV